MQPLASDHQNFLAQEYRDLWKTHGIEEGLLFSRPLITTVRETSTPPYRNIQVLFVGEECGAEEGKLLEKIIEAMGLTRDQVSIISVEMAKTAEAIQPRVVIALGEAAATTLLKSTASLSQLRGKFHPSSCFPSASVMPTFHPSHLLRTPSAKKEVWEDMKHVMAKLRETK